MTLSSSQLYFCDEQGKLFLFFPEEEGLSHPHSSSCTGMVASDFYVYTIGLDGLLVRYSREHRSMDHIKIMDLARTYSSNTSDIALPSIFNPPYPFSIGIGIEDTLACGMGNGMILIIHSWESKNSYQYRVLYSNAVHSFIVGEV